MTNNYYGDLHWVGGSGEYSPLVIDALEVLDGQNCLVVQFHSVASEKNDYRPYRGEQRAIPDRESYQDSGTGRRVFPLRGAAPVFQTRWFPLYLSCDSIDIRLEFRITELLDKEGKRFCYVIADWFERSHSTYSCHGLLEGCSPKYGERFVDKPLTATSNSGHQTSA